jgi:hypothetical protein
MRMLEYNEMGKADQLSTAYPNCGRNLRSNEAKAFADYSN